MFAGRKEQISQLLGSFSKDRGVINVIRGRRRIGKTRLIKELPKYGRGITLRYLTSAPPVSGMSDSDERTAYAEQVKSEFNLPYFPPHSSWRELFSFIGDLCSDKKTILAIDEVNWIATKSPSFMSIIFELWENQFTLKKNFMIILSGSLSSWIEENILMSKGFVGRVSISISLKELPLKDLPDFFGAKINKAPTTDIIKFISATGSIPRYLEEFDLNKTAEVNLANIAFNESGFLHDEFEKMFQDLFSKENKFYRNILETIANSSKLLTTGELASKMGLTYSGRHSHALKVLEEVGFIRKVLAWDLSSKKSGGKYVLRISDNYTAFYFRSIIKTKSQSLIKAAPPKNLSSLLGLQFENLTHNNIEFILAELRVESKDVVFAGSYVQTPTAARRGVQVDLLIQTRNRIYVCECKLYAEAIGRSIIKEVEDKIERLPNLKGVSFHPVLIHANAVSDSVYDEDYFNGIIDLGDALTK